MIKQYAIINMHDAIVTHISADCGDSALELLDDERSSPRGTAKARGLQAIPVECRMTLDAAMALAEERKREADTVFLAITALRLGLDGVDGLRPAHYGKGGPMMPIVLESQADSAVRDALAFIPEWIAVLDAELKRLTDEHGQAAERVRELDPITRPLSTNNTYRVEG